jgi:hypothetical protein
VIFGPVAEEKAEPPPASPINFMASFAREYAYTERALTERILQSPFIHFDETRLNIQGADHYVWVFTDLHGWDTCCIQDDRDERGHGSARIPEKLHGCSDL